MLSFGHMLPESVDILDSIGADRNLAFTFVLVGYMFVFFVEKIAFDAHSIMHQAMDDDAPVADLSHGHNHGHFYAHHDLAASLQAINHVHGHSHAHSHDGTAAACSQDHSHEGHGHGHGEAHDHTHTIGHAQTGHGQAATHNHSHAHAVAAAPVPVPDSAASSPRSSSKKESDSEKSALSPKSAIVLLIAMSLHRYVTIQLYDCSNIVYRHQGVVAE
jgi:hypothetical protein